MQTIPIFSESQLESLARILGECGTGSQISDQLSECHLDDSSGESTKWKRLRWAFRKTQVETKSPNQILAFTQHFLAPSRFIGESEIFESHRGQLNAFLSFVGFEFGEDGQFRKRTRVSTLTEAERRLSTMRGKLAHRAIHPEVMKYCLAEYLQENYFHATLEAVKGLQDRIRGMSGSGKDGAALIQEVFLQKTGSLLAFNTLQTEFEQGEHKGFANLLTGTISAVRNPLAHGPKIHWEGEGDTADFFSLLSLLHRKLDDCQKVPNLS